MLNPLFRVLLLVSALLYPFDSLIERVLCRGSLRVALLRRRSCRFYLSRYVAILLLLAENLRKMRGLGVLLLALRYSVL